jgi:transposase
MSTSVTRKALNLDDKVKAINLCDGGKSCRAVAKEMCVGRTHIVNILKRKSEILDDLKNNIPVQENVNVVQQEMKTLTNYAGIGFRKQLAEE